MAFINFGINYRQTVNNLSQASLLVIHYKQLFSYIKYIMYMESNKDVKGEF